jgi:aminomethyltransferase
MSDGLNRTSLYEAHLKAGARMVPFAGWEMPVQYASVIAEANAVRQSAGMFDVSHMGRLIIRGPESLAFLEKVTSNDVAKLGDRFGQYSLLPNPEGGCVDDIIVYHISGDEFRMVVNASNHEKDLMWLKSHAPNGLEIEDQTLFTAMIAVQGPSATAILAKLSSTSQALEDAPAFGVVDTLISGVPCFAARSGYTGEDGFELVCAASQSEALWDALVAAGVSPCGLASRDTLRVEAGLPLYGHELNDTLSPLAVNLGWVVSKTKTFIGSEHYEEARKNGTPQKIQGIRLSAKRLIPTGSKVCVNGQEVGEVTSGVVSPLLDAGIGFALIDSSIPVGTECTVDLRGKPEPAEIVGKRFYKRK